GGWRRGGGPLAPHQLHDLVPHLGLDGAQLVLYVDAVLLAQGQQVLALHVQLARQREDADFFSLLLLQAKLPVLGSSRHRFSPGNDECWGGLSDSLYSTGVAHSEKRSLGPGADCPAEAGDVRQWSTGVTPGSSSVGQCSGAGSAATAAGCSAGG